MSLAKILFSRLFNNMPVVVIFDELNFICNYTTHTGQWWLYVGSTCSREPMQNVGNSIRMHVSTFVEVYKGKTDNNDNSSGEILDKQ